MSDQEDFLTRWSRRKREVAEDKTQAEKPAAGQAEQAAVQGAAANQTVAARAPSESEFDVSSLPSIDSIGASSDITAFLQAGVPSSLRLAALRRAWVADPGIRDFVGLAENAWDFTDPNAMPGFGALDAGTDVQKLVAEIFRDAKPESETTVQAATPPSPAESSARMTDVSGIDSTVDLPATSKPAMDEPQPVAASSEEKVLLRREGDIAAQHDDAANESNAARVRRHGGAMPQ